MDGTLTRRSEPGGPGHEARDVALKGPLLFGAVLIAGILASLLLVRWTFDWLASREARAQAPEHALAPGAGRSLPPEPRLQMDPVAEYRAIRAQEEGILHGYGWVDKDAGIARIPIERAMDLILEEGLPARAAAGTAPATDDAGWEPEGGGLEGAP